MGLNPEDSNAAAIATAPNCGLEIVERSPNIAPIGVRFADITAIGSGIDYSITAFA
jgi:hypothetical protein